MESTGGSQHFAMINMKVLFSLFFSLFVKCFADDELSIPISTSGLRLPRIGLGTAGIRQETIDITKEAIELGYSMIDTAQAKEWYDESSVGTALRAVANVTLRESIVVVTKVHPRNFRSDKLRSAVTQSKINIYGSSSRALDVVLLHSPYCWTGSCSAEEESHGWQAAWNTLHDLKKEGEVTAIGVSNFDERLLQELLGLSDAKVAVIQNWMDPFHQDKITRELASANGIAYMAYSSFGTQWEWKLKRNPVFTDKVLQGIAHKHNRSVAQVVTSWVIQEDCVAIPRSSSKVHLSDNLVHPPGFLDSEDMSAIRALDGSLGSLW